MPLNHTAELSIGFEDTKTQLKFKYNKEVLDLEAQKIDSSDK